MALDDIIRKIEQDAAARVEDASGKAAEEAVRVRQDTEQRCVQLRETVLEEGRQRAGRERERLLSTARLEERKAVLAGKQELIEEIFREALERVMSLGEKDMLDLLSGVAIGSFPGGEVEIVLSPADRKLLGKKLVERINKSLSGKGAGAKAVLSQETRPIRGGLIMQGGKREVNCTFDALFKEKRSDLEAEVARILFSDGR